MAQQDEFQPETEILFVYEVVRHGARAPLAPVPLNGQLKQTDKLKKKEEKKKRKEEKRKKKEEKKAKAAASGQPVPEDKPHKKKHDKQHSTAQTKYRTLQKKSKMRRNPFNQTRFLMHSSQYDEYESEKEFEIKDVIRGNIER